MIVVFVLLLLGFLVTVDAQISPVHFGQGKKMTPEEFHKIPDDPFSDPAVDIPELPPNVKPGQAPYENRPEEVPFQKNEPEKKKQNLLPRDEYMEQQKKADSPQDMYEKRTQLWIDFPKIHEELIQEQSRPDASTHKPHRQQGYSARPPSITDWELKKDEFEPNGFGLKSENVFRNSKLSALYKPIVWSTCDDFQKGYKPFNPTDIINIMWIPFYTWSSVTTVTAMVHQFNIPTKKQIYDYYKNLSPYLNRSVDWNQPKLSLDQGMGEMEALLVSADRTGLFYYVMNMEIPEFVQQNNITLPLVSVRLKLVRDYLAMMYCERNFALIMARNGYVPPTNKDKREIAKLLGFRGKGRPVIRDVKYEQKIKEKKEKDKRIKEAMKYLPTDPDAGYFANEMALQERPMGRTHNQNQKYLKDAPTRSL